MPRHRWCTLQSANRSRRFGGGVLVGDGEGPVLPTTKANVWQERQTRQRGIQANTLLFRARTKGVMPIKSCGSRWAPASIKTLTISASSTNTAK